MEISVPSTLGVEGRLQYISERYWSDKPISDEDKALRQESFVRLAATYNEVMRAERAHRVAHNCRPNWECDCPTHERLGQDCADMYYRIERIDYGATDGTKRLSSDWWARRGFTMVAPGDDPVFDYVLLNGEIPVPQGVVSRAARWWVTFMASNLPGRARPFDRLDVFAAYQPTLFDPVDWTSELKEKLQKAIEEKLSSRFPRARDVSGLEPVEISAGRWGHDSLFSDVCLALDLGMPMFTSDVRMLITPAAITIEQTAWKTRYPD